MILAPGAKQVVETFFMENYLRSFCFLFTMTAFFFMCIAMIFTTLPVPGSVDDTDSFEAEVVDVTLHHSKTHDIEGSWLEITLSDGVLTEKYALRDIIRIPGVYDGCRLTPAMREIGPGSRIGVSVNHGGINATRRHNIWNITYGDNNIVPFAETTNAAGRRNHNHRVFAILCLAVGAAFGLGWLKTA